MWNKSATLLIHFNTGEVGFSIMETLEQIGKVPGCQPDCLTSPLSFSGEISCPVAKKLQSQSEVCREPVEWGRCHSDSITLCNQRRLHKPRQQRHDQFKGAAASSFNATVSFVSMWVWVLFIYTPLLWKLDITVKFVTHLSIHSPPRVCWNYLVVLHHWWVANSHDKRDKQQLIGKHCY